MPSAALRLRGVQPVESHEVVEAVQRALAASDAFRDHLRPAGALYAHRLPLRAPDGTEAEAGALWAVLREMGQVGGRSAPESVSGLATVRLQLQVSVDPDATDEPDGVLGYAHVLAWRALQGLLMDVADGSGRFQSTAQVTRTERPSPARLDDAGRLYSSAYFAASVRPVAPAQP